jgi:hypothetical protein
MLPLVAVGVALVVAGCMNPPAEGTGTSNSVASPTTPSAPETSCPASGVAVSAGPVDAAMGARGVTLTLANCGSAPYAVEGYPGIELIDEQQQAIDVQVLEEPDPIGSGAVIGPAPLILAPGQRAQAVLLWRNTVEVGREATPGSYLAVTPVPGDGEQLVELAVDLGTTGRLTVGPWTQRA